MDHRLKEQNVLENRHFRIKLNSVRSSRDAEALQRASVWRSVMQSVLDVMSDIYEWIEGTLDDFKEEIKEKLFRQFLSSDGFGLVFGMASRRDKLFFHQQAVHLQLQHASDGEEYCTERLFNDIFRSFELLTNRKYFSIFPTVDVRVVETNSPKRKLICLDLRTEMLIQVEFEIEKLELKSRLSELTARVAVQHNLETSNLPVHLQPVLQYMKRSQDWSNRFSEPPPPHTVVVQEKYVKMVAIL